MTVPDEPTGGGRRHCRCLRAFLTLFYPAPCAVSMCTFAMRGGVPAAGAGGDSAGRSLGLCVHIWWLVAALLSLSKHPPIPLNLWYSHSVSHASHSRISLYHFCAHWGEHASVRLIPTHDHKRQRHCRTTTSRLPASKVQRAMPPTRLCSWVRCTHHPQLLPSTLHQAPPACAQARAPSGRPTQQLGRTEMCRLQSLGEPPSRAHR